MSDKLTGSPCRNCSEGTYQPGLSTELLERGETTVVVKDVPAQVCDLCGDALMTGEVTDRLLEILDMAIKEGVRSVVRSYDPASERKRTEQIKKAQARAKERGKEIAQSQRYTQQSRRGPGTRRHYGQQSSGTGGEPGRVKEEERGGEGKGRRGGRRGGRDGGRRGGRTI